MAANVRKPILYTLEAISQLTEPPTPLSSLRHLCAKGALPSKKLGRRHVVKRADLASFLGIPVSELP